MFIVEFRDGTKYSSLDGSWSSIPRDKKIKKVSIIGKDLKIYSLEDYDTYLYAKEAITSSLGGTFDVAIWFGGFNEPSGDGYVLKLVLNDVAAQGDSFAPIPSNCKDFYPINRKQLGFAERAYNKGNK